MIIYPKVPLSWTETTHYSYLFKMGKKYIENVLSWWKINKSSIYLSKKPIKRLLTMSFLPFYCWGWEKGFWQETSHGDCGESDRQNRTPFHQVFYNTPLLFSIRLEFIFKLLFDFLGALGFQNAPFGVRRSCTTDLRTPIFSQWGKYQVYAPGLKGSCVQTLYS